MQELNESLSEREQEILRLVATGAANKEIARVLLISPNTVKVHLRNIFAKIGVSTRTEATLYAIQIGLINPGAAQNVEEMPQEFSPENNTAALPQAGSPPIVLGGLTHPVLPETAPQPETRRRSIQPWQFGLIVIATLLMIGSGVVSARMLLMPTPLPTRTAAIDQAPEAAPRWNEKKALPSPRKGMGIAGYENGFYLVGGATAQGINGDLLHYHPAEDRWETLADKPTPATDVQAALLGEKVYVPGGRLANGKDTNLLEVYDPRQNTWESRSSLPTPVSAYALAAFEGRLYLFGGKSGDQYLSSVYMYDPQEDRWQERAFLSTPRAYARAVNVGGKIQILGGYDGSKALTLNQVYFPSRDRSGETAWEDLAPLPEGRYAMGVEHLAGLVYLIGGQMDDSRTVPGMLQYLSQTDEWSTLEAPPVPIGAQPALLASGNFLYVFGGETPGGLSAANLSYQAIYTLVVPQLRSEE